MLRWLLRWLLGLLLKLLRWRSEWLHVCGEGYPAESSIVHIVLHG